MSKIFKSAEKYAIWTAHGEKCWVCRKPLPFLELQIDHVVPAALKAEPEALAALIKALGLPVGFHIESYENYRPACSGCNRTKSDLPYDAPIVGIEILQRLDRSEKARRLAEKVVNDRTIEKSIALISTALERDGLDPKHLVALREMVGGFLTFHEAERAPEEVGETVDFGFGNVISRDGLFVMVRQRYGIGRGPAGPEIPLGMRCGHCGNPYFNGARCTYCGMLDDG